MADTLIRYPFEERTRVLLVPDAEDGTPGIADITAPTIAELEDEAVIDITCFLTADGLNPGGTSNKVDGPTLCDKLDAQSIGSVGYDMSLKGYRDRAVDGDTFWNAVNWGDTGVLVIRRGVRFDADFEAAQALEDYRYQMGEPVMGPSARNTNQSFEVAMAIEAAEIKAVVAAGS